MAYIVTESCIRCVYTDCVLSCPVDCFHVGANMLVIDPEVCIDCGACIPECPAEAIFEESDVPADQHAFIKLNAQLSKQWPVITAMRPAHPGADENKGKPGKLALLDRRPG